MSKAAEISALALLIGAAGIAFRAFQTYRTEQGQVEIIRDEGLPVPQLPELDFSWLDGLLTGTPTVPTTTWPEWSGQGATPQVAVPPMAPMQGAFSRDEITLARTLVGESAPNNTTDAKAIAGVVMNRVSSVRWPGSIHDVCLQPKQFSCWNYGDPQRHRIKSLLAGDSSWFDQCLQIARQAARYQLPDTSYGATHYFANYIAVPSWVKNSPNAQVTTQVGVHQYYKGIA